VLRDVGAVVTQGVLERRKPPAIHSLDLSAEPTVLERHLVFRELGVFAALAHLLDDRNHGCSVTACSAVIIHQSGMSIVRKSVIPDTLQHSRRLSQTWFWQSHLLTEVFPKHPQAELLIFPVKAR